MPSARWTSPPPGVSLPAMPEPKQSLPVAERARPRGHQAHSRTRARDPDGLTQLERAFGIEVVAKNRDYSNALRACRPNTTQTDSSLRKEARKMAERPHVAKFIRGMMDRAASRAEITESTVLKELASIGLANIADLFDDDGRLSINPKHLTRQQAAGLGIEVTTEYGGSKGGTPPVGQDSVVVGAPSTNKLSGSQKKTAGRSTGNSSGGSVVKTRVRFKSLDKRQALMDIVGIMGWGEGVSGRGHVQAGDEEEKAESLDTVRRVGFLMAKLERLDGEVIEGETLEPVSGPEKKLAGGGL